MPEWKELRFKIEGKVNGVEMTPFTMPMARLALYLHDLAHLFGYRDSVHLISVEPGSAVPVFMLTLPKNTELLIVFNMLSAALDRRTQTKLTKGSIIS